MNISVRDFAEPDYPAIVAIHNAALPHDPASVAGMRHWDAHRDPRCKHRRWVAEERAPWSCCAGIHRTAMITTR